MNAVEQLLIEHDTTKLYTLLGQLYMKRDEITDKIIETKKLIHANTVKPERHG